MQALGDKEFQHLKELGEHHVQSVHRDLHNLINGNQHLAANGAQQTWPSGQCRLTWGGLFYYAFSADFPYNNNTLVIPFRGQGGGLGGGAGMAWGGLISSVNPTTLPGRSVNFQYNIAAAYVNINFWDKTSGMFLGSFVGAGTSFGLGTGGGTGTF